jgi:tetratricopeptide (TPR) repeat protein
MKQPIRGHKEGQKYRNELPIILLAEDSVSFPVEGVTAEVTNPEREGVPQWQRWNDYGIGMLLKGKAALRQATEAFTELEKMKRFDGPLNLARVLVAEGGDGQLDEAAAAITRAAEFKEEGNTAPPWTLAWLSGVINRQQFRLEEAEANFRQVLDYRTEDTVARKFDFSKDYEVINLLGQTIFDRAVQIRSKDREEERTGRLKEAVAVFQKTLAIDTENVDAHYNLSQLYSQLGEKELSEKHQKLHAKYKPDDTARGQAVSAARQKYPAADFASEPLVIYDLQRK